MREQNLRALSVLAQSHCPKAPEEFYSEYLGGEKDKIMASSDKTKILFQFEEWVAQRKERNFPKKNNRLLEGLYEEIPSENISWETVYTEIFDKEVKLPPLSAEIQNLILKKKEENIAEAANIAYLESQFPKIKEEVQHKLLQEYVPVVYEPTQPKFDYTPLQRCEADAYFVCKDHLPAPTISPLTYQASQKKNEEEEMPSIKLNRMFFNRRQPENKIDFYSPPPKVEHPKKKRIPSPPQKKKKNGDSSSDEEEKIEMAERNLAQNKNLSNVEKQELQKKIFFSKEKMALKKESIAKKNERLSRNFKISVENMEESETEMMVFVREDFPQKKTIPKRSPEKEVIHSPKKEIFPSPKKEIFPSIRKKFSPKKNEQRFGFLSEKNYELNDIDLAKMMHFPSSLIPGHENDSSIERSRSRSISKKGKKNEKKLIHISSDSDSSDEENFLQFFKKCIKCRSSLNQDELCGSCLTRFGEYSNPNDTQKNRWRKKFHYGKKEEPLRHKRSTIRKQAELIQKFKLNEEEESDDGTGDFSFDDSGLDDSGLDE